MGYEDWYIQHGKKHRKIVEKLVALGYTKDRIIEYFDFDSMVVNEPDFCVLYAQPKKCHAIEQLNCFLCACPLFRFNDNGVELRGNHEVRSFCMVDSKHGSQRLYGEVIHQDCTNCTVPHSKKYVQKNFGINWFEVMRSCNTKN